MKVTLNIIKIISQVFIDTIEHTVIELDTDKICYISFTDENVYRLHMVNSDVIFIIPQELRKLQG
jgi:hypothetical protein